MFIFEARDQYPASVSKQDIDEVLSRGRFETRGLDYKILIKENARVMLTSNRVSVKRRLQTRGKMQTEVIT